MSVAFSRRAGPLGLVGLLLCLLIGLFLAQRNDAPTGGRKPADVTDSRPVQVTTLIATARAESTPFFMESEFLHASLEALQSNGSDLSLPMPSKHVVRCETRELAAEVTKWGEANGFEIDKPTIFLGHGSVEFFDVTLRQTDVPHIPSIQKQGRLVQSRISVLPGAVYNTWVGEIVSL